MMYGRRLRLRWWQQHSFGVGRGRGPGRARLRFDEFWLTNTSAGYNVSIATFRWRLRGGSVGPLVDGRLSAIHENGGPGRHGRMSEIGGFGPQVNASQKKLADAAQPFIP